MLFVEPLGHYFPAFTEAEANRVEQFSEQSESIEHFRELFRDHFKFEPDIIHTPLEVLAYLCVRPDLVMVNLNQTLG